MGGGCLGMQRWASDLLQTFLLCCTVYLILRESKLLHVSLQLNKATAEWLNMHWNIANWRQRVGGTKQLWKQYTGKDYNDIVIELACRYNEASLDSLIDLTIWLDNLLWDRCSPQTLCSTASSQDSSWICIIEPHSSVFCRKRLPPQWKVLFLLWRSRSHYCTVYRMTIPYIHSNSPRGQFTFLAPRSKRPLITIPLLVLQAVINHSDQTHVLSADSDWLRIHGELYWPCYCPPTQDTPM